MEVVTKALLKMIAKAGYGVRVTRTSLEAIDNKTGERYIVVGDGGYTAAVELAQMLGFDLDE